MNLDQVRFITDGVTPEEKAAVLAVLDAHIEEESALEHAIQGTGLSDWEKSARGIREPLHRGRVFGHDFGH
ncbi:MAG: hypothetical protein RIR88_594 [Actinomycetota bacterium]